jgi:hypothetical protein
MMKPFALSFAPISPQPLLHKKQVRIIRNREHDESAYQIQVPYQALVKLGFDKDYSIIINLKTLPSEKLSFATALAWWISVAAHLETVDIQLMENKKQIFEWFLNHGVASLPCIYDIAELGKTFNLKSEYLKQILANALRILES